MPEEKNMIKRVLVALDGSEAANRALDFALDLAKKYSGEIVLLSVVPPVIMPPAIYAASGAQPVAPVVTDRYLKQLRSSHEKVLSEALEKAREDAPDLEVSTRLIEGRPSEAIVEVSEEGDFDIVVLGSRGLGGVKEFLLGSVSHRVADKAKCPVLIVK